MLRRVIDALRFTDHVSSMFIIGQRWVSESEPELGLGVVIDIGDRDVCIQFGAGEEMRRYAVESAPVRRVIFAAGDTVATRDDTEITVDEVIDDDGLITYVASATRIAEAALSDRITFNQPLDRLQKAHVDEPLLFDLRVEALTWRNRSRQSSIRGLVGGRVNLIPHQIYIANEVANRPIPRVLLADEVGLGKTIEAGLIVHRLNLNGLASRVLILVPDSLIHQWFLEFYRRFNMWFSIYDQARCDAVVDGAPGGNPFLDQQLILCGISFLTGSERYRNFAVEAGWDVVVVDEAHHLRWTPVSSSPEYELVNTLSQHTPGLLLLTATPEQLGHAGHFARLRLLDPDRYPDFLQFEEEAAQFGDVAAAAGRLVAGSELTDDDCARIKSVFPEDEAHVEQLLCDVCNNDDAARSKLLKEMLDRHGPGRVMFRNTRHVIQGFPKRIFKQHILDGTEANIEILRSEFESEKGNPKSEVDADDPRIVWLAALLQELAGEKVLLICRTTQKAIAIDEALQKSMNVKSTLFHEGLELIIRDRNASWFAEPEGARILICSEIGSEGRNFQFAHHLVLFDLPMDPELLEQRIGRLDRIGQTADIKIHVPVVAGSPQARLAEWYADGLDAFSGPTTDAELCIEKFGARLSDLALAVVEDSVDAWRELVTNTRAYHDELACRAAIGRDHLLELSSCNEAVADTLVTEIAAADEARTLEKFMYDVFEWYGVKQEELAPRSYVLSCEELFSEGIPGLSNDGASVTFSRRHALTHENLEFLTSDHPMVIGAVDMLLGSERGNSSLATLEGNERAVLLETVFLLEPTAPTRLHADRFLAPTPIRIVVDHQQKERTASFTQEFLHEQLHPGEGSLLDRRELTHTLIPAMCEQARVFAERQAAGIRAEAVAAMSSTLGAELERLQALRKINDHVRDDEVEALTAQLDELRIHLEAAELRLDCVRVIWVSG